MERDEAGTLARLKTQRKELVGPLVAEHRGRVVKLTGDGGLYEFTSIVHATVCAVASQRGMAEREADAAADKRVRLRVSATISAT